MNALPRALYRAHQVRELDRIAMEAFGIPGSVLMERAGAAAFDALRGQWPQARRIAVLCGTGNNGGDGFVLARLAREAGLAADVYQVGDPARLKGDALAASQRLLSVDVEAAPWRGQALDRADVVVDALLGTGLSGQVAEPWRGAVAAVNAAGRPVLALDVPSGLNADTGQEMGVAVRAAVTITFVGLKRGLFMEAGRECTGRLLFDDLKLPPEVYRQGPPAAERLDPEDLAAALGPRPRQAHKGDFGHVLVVGGEAGLSGAARLAAEAAARVGAGLVSVATRAAHAAVLNAGRPELMCHAVESPRDLGPLLRRATVVVCGPGLGQGAWGRALLGRVLESPLPLVVDGDGLNALALDPVQREDWVLTPHPGEAGRLLGMTAAEVQADRFAAAAALRERYGGTVVLKGAGTLVRGPDGPTALCPAGNPGMASGGMGDVLAGVIGGLLAQGMAPAAAARLGVCLHGAAGDGAARAGGERGLLAADLMPWLRRLANPRPGTP